MKTLCSWSTKILFILLLVAVWHIYQQNVQYESLQANYEALEAELNQSKQALAELDQKNQALEKASVDGLLRETNKIVVSGWETLLNAVEGELDKARELIQQKSQDEHFSEENEPVEPEAPIVIDGERT